MKHLDRVFIGVNTLFVFKFPMSKICDGKPESYICSEDQYPESMIESDNENCLDFDAAYQEAT